MTSFRTAKYLSDGTGIDDPNKESDLLTPALLAQQGAGYGPVVVFEGDSRIANGGVASDPYYNSYGLTGWVRAFAQCKPITYNLAVSGATSAQVLARVNAVNALKPFAVFLWCGVNDIATGVSGATAAANVIAACRSYLANGARYVVVEMETGFVGWAAGDVAQMLTLNRALIAFAASNRNIRLVNTLELVVNYAAATQVPITYRAGVFADTVHPSVNLSYRLGVRNAALLDSLWRGVELPAYLMPGDTSNLLTNPNFSATTAVSGMAGWSGTLPTGYFGFQSGTISVVASVQANATVPNLNETRLVLTASAAGVAYLWQDPVAGIVAGNYIVGSAELEITGTPVNLLQAQPSIYTLVGGVTKFGYPLFYSAAYDPAPPNSSWPQVAMTQYSPETKPILIGAGVQTNMRFSIAEVQFSGAGSATVLIRKPLVKIVPSTYVS